MSAVRDPLYFEDLLIGQSFSTGIAHVTADSIKEFAATYDPQPMHLDEEAAKDTFFGQLVGSGWQALCLTMRLAAEADWLGGTPLIGAEVNDIRFKRPMLPGEELRVEAEIVDLLPPSKSGRSFAVMLLTTYGNDTVLLTQRWRILLPSRALALNTN
ncbi:MaoC/PaaZ C-terminal domain-containing protein [Lacibacterium aquatile]|uniref:MaoC/PaaZ C-terminal domain-containing protein n=1 Tax=Lacibacterium aquatile TaxID=1168082 RepID=A0ABW5DML3_9PROT